MEFFLYTCKFMYEIYACLRVYRYFYMYSCTSRKSCKSLKLNATSHIACLLCIYYIHFEEWFFIFKLHIINYIFTVNFKLISVSINFRLARSHFTFMLHKIKLIYSSNNSLFYSEEMIENLKKHLLHCFTFQIDITWISFFTRMLNVRLDFRFQASSYSYMYVN